MTIYKILSDTRFALVYPDFKAISLATPDRKTFLAAKGNRAPFGNSWVALDAIVEDGTRIPDISRLSGSHLVLSPHALDLLKPTLKGLGELLPVQLNGAQFTLFNCTNNIDKIDEKNSRLNEFDEIEALAFAPEPVSGQMIWITRYGTGQGLFCGSEFKTLVEDHNLTGLNFSTNLAARK